MAVPTGDTRQRATSITVARRRVLGQGIRVLGALGAVNLLAACGAAAAVSTGSSTGTTSALATSATTASTASAAPVVTSAGSTTATAAATSSASGSAAAAGKAVTLDFWNPATDDLGKAILAGIVDRFNAQSTSFQVKNTIVGDDNNYQKYTTAIAGGAPPDAIMTYDYTPLPKWVYDGALQPLDAYANEMKINKDDYFPIIWPMISLRGHLWGFMQEFDSSILAWNKSIFSKSGLDPEKPPKSIPELDDMITKLTQKDSTGAITQLGLAPGDSNGGNDFTWLAAFGGMYYDTLKEEFTITRQENIAALDWMAGWWKKLGGRSAIADFKKKFSQASDQINFTQEDQALAIIGEYKPIVYKQKFPNLNFASALIPVQTGVFYGSGVAGGGNVFIIPKGIGHLQESLNFIKYMGGPGPVLEWNVKENNLPPVKSVAFDPNFASAVPLMKPWIDMLKANEQDNHMIGPITHPALPDFNTLKGPIYTNILDGKINAQQGLEQLQQQFQPVLDKYK